MRTPWLILIAGLLLPVCTFDVHAEEDGPTPTEAEALLVWVDRLDWPEFETRPFVRVATGFFNQLAREPKNHYVHGFLLSDDGKRFKVLPLGHYVGGSVWGRPMHEYERSPEGTAERARVGYETLDLAPIAKGLLGTFPRTAPRYPEEEEGLSWTPTGVLMAAKALDATGHGALARQLIQQARFKNRDETQPLAVAARVEIGHNTMWRNIGDFGDPKITFATLRDHFRYFLELFPESPHRERAETTLAMLETMVAEQETHDAAQKPWEEMSQAERIAELVFQLRTQNGQQWSQPGACSIWADDRDEESPASRLRAMGYVAVPALIEVVEDERFTRSVGFHRDFYFSHYVLRVGDAANDILCEITGSSYYRRQSTSGAMVKDGEAEGVKASWQRWWQAFQEKGEKQVLIDAVTDTADVEQATRLWKKYPDEAVPVILAALPKATEAWHRTGYLSLIGTLPGAEAERLLHAELMEGTHLAARLEVARILYGRQHPDALPVMIELWQQLRQPRYGRDELIEFLAASGDMNALAGLAEGLADRSAPVRIELGRSFATLAARLREGDGRAFTREYRDGVEALLVGRLTETDRWEGCSMSFGKASFSNPRVCDLTAYTLHEIWPDRYPAFDPDRSQIARTRSCLEAANVWRRARGLVPFPLPASRAPKPMDAALAETLLRRARSAENQDARTAAIEELAGHGLRALPPIRAALSAPGVVGEVRDALLALDKRLAAIVSEFTFDPDDLVGADDPVRAFAAGLVGRSLTADDFVGILTRFCTEMPTGVVGLRLSLDREGDGSGVRLALVWMPGEPLSTNSGWSYSFGLRAGTEPLTGGGGGASTAFKRTPEGWSAYHEKLVDALDSKPGTSIEGFISIRQSED